MLKNILNLSDVSVISKKNQSSIHGGSAAIGSDCIELPPDCENFGQVLRDCACVYQ